MKYLGIFFCALVSFVTYGQNDIPHRYLVFRKAPTGFVTQLPPAPPQTVGNYYLNEEWQTATVFLVNEEKLEDIQVRLNLKDNNLEINYNGQVKVLQAGRILSFIVSDPIGGKRHYVNANSFKNSLKINGFLEVLEEGSFSLLMQTKVELVQANYNVALDVGSKDHQVVKTKVYYIANDADALQVIANRKKMNHAFKEAFQFEISKQLDELDTNLKKENDLVSLVRNLNKDNS